MRETTFATVGGMITALFPKGFREPRDSLNQLVSSIEDDEMVGAFDAAIDALSRSSFLGEGKTLRRRPVKPAEVPELYRNPPWAPFDAFAIAAALLARSGAYHHVEPLCEDVDSSQQAKTSDEWPLWRGDVRTVVVSADERRRCEESGFAWRMDFPNRRLAAFDPYFDAWQVIIKAWSEPVFSQMGATERPPKWWGAALRLLMISDQAASGVGIIRSLPLMTLWAFLYSIQQWLSAWPASFDEDAQAGGEGRELAYTISWANPDVACVLPKCRTAQLGATLRSLSHNLAFLPPRGLVRCKWKWPFEHMERSGGVRDRLRTTDTGRSKPFNLLIVPYPFEVRAKDFRPKSSVKLLRNHSTPAWSNFVAYPEEHKEAAGAERRDALVEFLIDLLKVARADVGEVHGIVLPELALSAAGYDAVKSRVIRPTADLELFATGLFERPKLDEEERAPDLPDAARLANQAAMLAPIREGRGDTYFVETTHRKHHRWRLDARQIADYALGASLDPSRLWWEDSRAINREVPVYVMRGRWSVTTLICEDLARVDPAQELLRAIGPNLVIALLMDSAQTPQRWPARYATVLGEDPGSSVLTLTSLGLLERVNASRRYDRSRSIGLWREGGDSATLPLELPEGHHGLILTLTEKATQEFTMDGRRKGEGSATLALSGLRPIAASNTAPPRWGA